MKEISERAKSEMAAGAMLVENHRHLAAIEMFREYFKKRFGGFAGRIHMQVRHSVEWDGPYVRTTVYDPNRSISFPDEPIGSYPSNQLVAQLTLLCG